MGNKQVKVPIGMRSSYWWPIIAEPAAAHPTYGSKVDMGAAQKGAVTITTAPFDYYGDDVGLIHDESYVSHQADVETSLSDLELNAQLFGHAYNNGQELSGSEDTSGLGAYGFIEPILKRDKTKVYRATFFYRMTAMASSEKQDAETKNSAINPKNFTVSLYGTVDNLGKWRAREDFNTEADAEAFLDACAGQSGMLRIGLVLAGNGTAVPPAGSSYVASGANYTVEFSKAPTKVYDSTGGTTTDVTASVSNKTLVLSNVSAAHDILAIFA